jgi:hypothetical protein
MKLRWTILFYSTLAALAGVSWIAHSLDIGLRSLMTASLVGMIAACGVAFFAMIRAVPDKWPAAIVLVCASPMALDVVQWIDDLGVMFRFLGPSIVLMTAGAVATAVASVAILVAKPPAPPRQPPVAPARAL